MLDAAMLLDDTVDSFNKSVDIIEGDGGIKLVAVLVLSLSKSSVSIISISSCASIIVVDVSDAS